MLKRSLIVTVLVICAINLGAQENKFSLDGQADSWIAVNPGENTSVYTGLRYIPSLKFEKKYTDTSKLELEVSVNTYANLLYYKENFNDELDLKPYRIWLRYSTKKMEIRAGLQKINFGSATLLRPLMWFDKMDPRDPLQITDGVYGIMGRYFFKNNANVWIWALIYNKDPKGWELAPSDSLRPEIGGRIQLPMTNGEIALSYHNRSVNYFASGIEELQFLGNNITENKLSIDGKWDLTVGLWFESLIQHQNINKTFKPWQKQLNVGVDYTFPFGNGLHISHELLAATSSENALQIENGMVLSGLSMHYPIGLFDSVSAMFFFSYTTNDFYRFVSWQKQFDKLSMNLMLYWNPETFSLFGNTSQVNSILSGKGIQFKIVYNH